MRDISRFLSKNQRGANKLYKLYIFITIQFFLFLFWIIEWDVIYIIKGNRIEIETTIGIKGAAQEKKGDDHIIRHLSKRHVDEKKAH